MRIACLHTARSNVAVFEAARAAAGLPPGSLCHEVRADLLGEVERECRLTASVRWRTRDAIAVLRSDADVVLLTCSTLGPVVERTWPEGAPVMRADAALAEAVVAGPGRLVVLCASPTTLAASQALFEAAARQSAARIEVRLVQGAWPLFRSGSVDAYLDRIAEAITVALQEGFDRVALAQASMAPAALRVAEPDRVLTVPETALRAAVKALTGEPLAASRAS